MSWAFSLPWLSAGSGHTAENCCWPGVAVNRIGHQQKRISDLSVQHRFSPAEPATDGRRNRMLQGPGQSGHRMEGFSEWMFRESHSREHWRLSSSITFFFFFDYSEGLWDCSLPPFQHCFFEVTHWPLMGSVRKVISGVAKWKVEQVFLKILKVSENTLGHVVWENRL